MLWVTLSIFFYINYGESRLWTKGVVHYAINKKDYDLHSQDIIVSTFDRIQKEICVKFFNTPLNYSASDTEKILYISNPDKRKTCPPEAYDYDGSVVDMPIGYKCLNDRDIARIVVDMLRASIVNTGKPNSNDLYRHFQIKESESNSTKLLSASDRNFINTYYHMECGNLVLEPVVARRAGSGTMEITPDNERFYKDKLWPLGIVMYGVDEDLSTSKNFLTLQQAMTAIELSSCIVFQRVWQEAPLQAKNLLWFGVEGEYEPNLGFMTGKQSIVLSQMVNGAPGHDGHTLNLLMRILGIPMMSNRYDRDNYVTINWKNVAKMMEHHLERSPLDAWLRNAEGDGVAYDFTSVTHAPVNYMCSDCSLGQQTVTPKQDHLWQRTLSMGHSTELSPGDIEMLHVLYNEQCNHRLMTNSK